jgi:glycerophosphoryl diester phosphodiesterase
MQIIAHRGQWENPTEKNSLVALSRALNNRYGIEIDLRDYREKIVISHDLANEKSVTLNNFFELYKKNKSDCLLALNIKSDGLQDLLLATLNQYKVKNYFVFDMSIPDSLGYLKKKINIFTRHSEYEEMPAFYDKVNGVWLDEFNKGWINKEKINLHNIKNKKICLVSPELHGRNYMDEWKLYKEFESEGQNKNLMLCTDYPEIADEFFNQK